MRRHGWELPYHPLQIVAIAVFLALAFAFYVFLAPFIGTRLMEIFSISIYSPLMMSVFGLYIWCAAANPADPAVFLPKKKVGSCTSRTTSSGTSSRIAGTKNETSTDPSSLAPPSSAHSKSSKGLSSPVNTAKDEPKVSVWRLLPKSLCFCCDFKCDEFSNEAYVEEDKLYCTLCEVEISKRSKHCRVCDKCIDCFDHHCRWLNNCIGRKNYRPFITLVVLGLCLLVLEWVAGVWVISRCFLNRGEFQEEISSRLGSSFSVPPFLIVVASCTLLAAFATLPLVQLCLFHALLIYKGMSTYDYIVGMRDREQNSGVMADRFPSPFASPSSSVATAMSGASSVGAFYHASRCTPPHPFVDRELSADKVDECKLSIPETQTRAQADGRMKKPPPVKISPWALARLNPEDAVRAVGKARRQSSILRPVSHKDAAAVVIAETDSSCDPSSDEVTKGIIASMSSPMAVHGHNGVPIQAKRQQNGAKPRDLYSGTASKVLVTFGGDAQGYIERGGYSAEVGATIMPLQREARNAFCGRSVGSVSRSGSLSTSASSSESNAESPEIPHSRTDFQEQRGTSSSSHSFIQRRDALHEADTGLHAQGADSLYDKGEEHSHGHRFTRDYGRPVNDGYEASGGESADDSDTYCQLQEALHLRDSHADVHW
ncbi:hypothetical protein KP509_01G002000 [Ceratopteris richardii]|uniref:S-acyltransferase n=1 Tax=Ceratopteris richardii TaxID=49495 RepID=A0A8T2VI48_CERRI|nr:hypothetical protein KP509_01G002000 [Ceratopteris richardii]